MPARFPGVTTIHQTQCYQAAPGAAPCRGPWPACSRGPSAGADLNVYWGAAGVVDSVVDITHNVLVPFDTMAAGSWGILNPRPLL